MTVAAPHPIECPAILPQPPYHPPYCPQGVSYIPELSLRNILEGQCWQVSGSDLENRAYQI